MRETHVRVSFSAGTLRENDTTTSLKPSRIIALASESSSSSSLVSRFATAFMSRSLRSEKYSQSDVNIGARGKTETSFPSFLRIGEQGGTRSINQSIVHIGGCDHPISDSPSKVVRGESVRELGDEISPRYPSLAKPSADRITRSFLPLLYDFCHAARERARFLGTFARHLVQFAFIFLLRHMHTQTHTRVRAQIRG